MGPSCRFLLAHEEMVDLLRYIAVWAGLDSYCHQEYGELEVVCVQDGRRFLNILRGGPRGLLKAKACTVDDLTDDEIECVERMGSIADQWQEMIGDDGSLRIYVD